MKGVLMNKKIWALSMIFASQIAMATGFEIKDAWARATVGQPQSGAFMHISNQTSHDDVLIDVSIDETVAKYGELHTFVHENGVAKMRKMEAGIPIKAGDTLVLKPGAYHIMLLGLKKDLAVGTTFPLTLKFKSGVSVKTDVNVQLKQDGHHHNHVH